MSIAKRLIAAFLCLIMVLGEIPVSAESGTVEGPVYTLQAGGAQDQETERGYDDFSTSVDYFNYRKGTYVSVSAKAVTAGSGNTEDIGRVFRYDGSITFRNSDFWLYKISQNLVPLFDSYQSVSVKVKAPEGIVLCDINGAALSNNDGWVTLSGIADDHGNINAQSSESQTTRDFTVYAKMTGNGSTATKEYSALEFDVSMDVSVCATDKANSARTSCRIENSDVTKTNNTAVKGNGEAEWTVRKSAVPYDDKNYVQVDGNDIILTYEVEVGRSVNGNPSDASNDYVRYGTLDIDSMTLTDTVTGLTDVTGKTVYPSSLTVTPSDGVTINAGNTGFTANASSLNTVDASSVGIEGSVKKYTKYTVTERYQAADFTYALTDPAFPDFDFVNSATLTYTTKDGKSTTSEKKSATISWHAVAGGGSLAVSELFFLTEEAEEASAKKYNEFYRAKFGNVKYTIYRADDQGNPIKGTGAWHRELSLSDGQNGTVKAGDIPVGKIAIYPDYSETSSGWVNPVSANNKTAPEYIVVDILEGSESQAAFGLRYVNGGFISAQKAFYDREGNKLSDSEASSLLSNTEFVFTPVSGSTGEQVTMQIGTDGMGLVPVRPGTYSVTEKAPDGYVAAVPGTIAVDSGEEKALNGGEPVKNYPSKALLTVGAKMSDKWVSGDAAETDSVTSPVTGSDLIYVIEREVNGDWEATGISVSLSDGAQEIYLDRYDENGDLITYRVRETGNGDRTRLGSILENANDGMSVDEAGKTFTFPETDMIKSLVWYYRNFGSVKVVKSVNDIRTAEPVLNGWAFSLFAGENGEPVRTGSTDEDGIVEFTGLVKTDESGDYIYYYVKETVDAGVWETAYVPAGSAEQSGRVSFAPNAKKEITVEKVITVTNTIRQGSITFTKVDADKNSTVLEGAQYKIFTDKDGTTLWLTSGKHADTGARLFSEAKTDAEVFTTNESGVISVSNVPSGYTYFAEEIAAPEGYFTAEAPVELGVLASGEAKTVGTVTDTHHPGIKVTKHTVDIGGNDKTVAAGTTATFALYVKNGERYDRVTDKSGNGITFTVTAGSELYSFASGDFVELPDYGEYYLVETSASPNILMPSVKPSGKQHYETITVGGQGYLAHGPYMIEAGTDGKAVNLNAEAYDVVNEASLTVSKKDAKTNAAVTDSFKYVIAARVKDGDTATLGLLGSDWTTTDPTGTTGDFAAVAGAAGTGYNWYFSPEMSGAASLPWYGSDGEKIVYYVIETAPPKGYLNKIRPDGTLGYHVEPVTLSDNAAYTAEFLDAPEMKATVGKVYKNVWDIVSGNPIEYDQTGVTLSLYHVNKEGILDRHLGSKPTNPKAVFNDVPMDFRERYLVVETNSNGYDSLYDPEQPGKSGGKKEVVADSLIGKSVTEVMSASFETGYNCVALNFDPASEEYNVDLNAGLDIGRTLTNYVPYIQFIVKKYGYHTDTPDNRQLLDQSKFLLYTISKDDFEDVYHSDPAAAVGGTAKTDGYVYESGMLSPGTFATLAYDYDEQLVFIFEEIEPTPGYSLVDGKKYTVVTPEQYQQLDYKNGAMTVEINNVTDSGDGDGSVRYYRVELDKCVDSDNDGQYSTGDMPLADVTFTLALADKEGKRVFDSNAEDPFYTFFTTGTDTTGTHGHGYARSETKALNRDIVASVPNPDNVFTFKYHTETEGYVTKEYADYIGAKQKAEQEGDLIIDNFELTFRLLLTEESYPLNVTPYNINHYVTITTAGGTVTDSTYTIENGNPILNVSGKYVLAQARKFVEGGRWSPKTADDYVTFKFVWTGWHAGWEGLPAGTYDESVKEQTVTIDVSNYNNLPSIYLLPRSDYYMTETHAPTGYDRPPVKDGKTNRVNFTTGGLETRVSDQEDVRVQKIDLTDTPYVTFTVTKQDSAKAAVSGKTLKVVYSSGNNAGAVLDANAEALGTDVTVMTTDASGNAVFTLPKYDYRTVDDYGASKTNASYTVIELENGERAAGFDVLNGTVTTVNINTDDLEDIITGDPKDIIVSNPEPADVRLIKIGVLDQEYNLANVSFKLYYAPFNKHSEYADANAPVALADNSNRWQLKDGNVQTNGYGEITFNGLYSGYYKLVETIPEGYMYEGGTYTVQFVLVTPGDAASLTNIRSYSGKYWEGTPVTILSQKVSDTTAPADPAYNKAAAGYTDGAITLTVKNTHKGALDITKLFETNTVGVTIPSTVKYYVIKDVIKGKDTVEKVTVETVDVAISGVSGSAKATLGSYILLEPGIYSVVEETEPGSSFFATASVSGAAEGNREETIVEPAASDNKVLHTVGTFKVTPANTVGDTTLGTTDNPVTVAFTNRTARMRLVAKKVDDTGKVLKGAGFIVFDVKDGKTYYYAGTDTNGMGKWYADEAKAVMFVTDGDGILSIEFPADYGLLTPNESGEYTASYGIREVKADISIRELVEDTAYVLTAGSTVDISGNEDEYLLDGTGLAIDLVLHGRTYAHATSGDGKETPLVGGAVFKLFKKGTNGKYTLVDSYTDAGVHISSVTTNGSGSAGFCYLDKPEAGEQYVLVETAVAGGYHGTDVYIDACVNGSTPLTGENGKVTFEADGVTYIGYVVNFTVEELASKDPADHVKTIDVYNMPYSRLLVLKYDYDYPKLQIPVGATFDVYRAAAGGTEEVQLTRAVNVGTSVDEVTISLAAQDDGAYGYVSGKNAHFSDSTADYSYFAITNMQPGSYTITEKTQAEGYFYTPEAGPTDPWYPVKTVDIDDDGGLTVVRFANIPNPEANDLNIDKTVSQVEGKGAEGALVNLQELREDGQRQSITFTISDFAPGKGPDEVVPEAVAHPMTSLELADSGLTFKDSSKTAVSNVDYRIEALTVGKANYLEPAEAFRADVYGIGASGAVKIAENIDIGSGAQTVDVTGGAYTGFRIVYGPGLERIGANFKAEPVTVKYSMLQTDDAEQDLVREITNTASVTMGYDIGIDDEDAEFTFTLSDKATVEAEATIALPTAAVTKVAQIKKGMDPNWGNIQPKDRAAALGMDDEVRYTVTFTNTDDQSVSPTGLGIPDPFIVDALPASIDVTSVTAETDAGSKLRLDDPVTENGQVYVKGSGMLEPGKTITLYITGKVNAAEILVASEIKNEAYAGSTTVIGINKQNPNGAPFKAGDAAPAYTAPEPFGSYGAVKDNVDHVLVVDGDLTIVKSVAGDVTGKNNFMSGTEKIAVTDPEGGVYYKLVIKSAAPVSMQNGGLRIADILPGVSDHSINGALRFSGFAVTDISNVSVSKNNGTPVAHTVYYTGSTTPDDYQNALTTGVSAGSTWSTSSSNAKGFFIQINEDILNDDVVTVAFTCKAPQAVKDEGSGVYSYNYYKWAINTAAAAAYSPKTSAMALAHSNPAIVTMMPKFTASIGDRVWLDKNANGMQDKGEPDFALPDHPGAPAITLRTFKNDDASYSSGSAKDLNAGWYSFGGLSAALLTDVSESAYDANGNAVLTATNFNGSIRYFYQLAVNKSAIPEGYIVTKPYAKNGGNATTFAVKMDPSTHLLVYDKNTGDGHEEDSDFRPEGDKYVSTRFYLPLQIIGENDSLKYDCFDLGLIRTRDLKITKKGADGKPVAGATFEVYGPFETPPESLEGHTPLTEDPLTTNENGYAELISDSSTYLNYYSYYVLVETSAPKPYTTNILALGSNTGNASLTEEKGNTILLAPADENGTERVEEIGVTDEYVAGGTFTLTQLGLNKVLNGADITSDFFKNLFTFSYTSDDPLFGEARSMRNEAGLIVDSKGNKEINIVVRRPLAEGEALTYTYTFTENDVKIKVGETEVTPGAILKDDTVYKLTLTITDPEGNGVLDIVPQFFKVVNGVEEEVDKFTFTNTLALGDLTIAKAVRGTPAGAPEGAETETFAFTVKLTPESGLEPLVYGKTFTVMRTPATGGDPVPESVTFGADGTAAISLAAGESVTIKDIPVNTAYTVTEADYSARGYLVTEINGTVSSDRVASGTIVSGETGHDYTYTNVRNAGDLIVSKNRGGNAFEENRDFTFTVVLEREDNVAIARSYDAVRTEADQTTTEGSVIFNEDKTTGVISATFRLRGGQSLRIRNIESGTHFTITEQAVGQYGYTVSSEGAEGDIPAPGENGTVADSNAAFTNTRNTGTLSIKKMLSGNAADIQKTFVMNVKLSYPAIIDLGTEANLPVFPDGCTHSDISVNADSHKVTFTVTLKAGETIAVSNILYGTSFEVTEADYTGRGYDAPEIINPDGTIDSEHPDPSVTVQNARSVGSLALTKETEGTGAQFRNEFDFRVRLTYDLYETRGIVPDLKDEANVPVADIGEYVKETRIVSATDTAPGYVEYDVQLPAGKTLTISNILNGAQYEIVETDYSAEGYLETKINGEVSSNLTAKGTIGSGEAACTYTNVRNSNGLAVRKELSGNGVSYDRPFEFTVTLLKRSDTAKIDRTYPAILTDAEGKETKLDPGAAFKADENGNAAYVFKLKGNETLTILDIVAGTDYVVEETDATRYAEGYVAVNSPSRGTIESNVVRRETVRNERNLGKLRLTKELAGNSPRAITEFDFEITLRRTDGVPVAGTYTTGENGKGTIVFKESGSGSAKATVRLSGGQSLIINDILAGTNYLITEEDYGYEGYSTDWRNASGRISETAVASAVCTNTRNTGELSISKTVTAIGMGIPGQAYVFRIDLRRPNGTGFNGTLRTDGGTGRITFVNGAGTVSLKHGETVTIKDILVGSTYTVTEDEYPNTTVRSSGTSGRITTEGAECLFENTVRQVYTNLTVAKEFKDRNKNRPASVTVRVSNRDGVIGEYELSKSNGWRVTVTGLPRYDNNGEEYIYSVVEVGSTEGYHVVYSVHNGVVTVTNIRKDDIFNDGYITILDDLVAKGGGINMNEGYCFD